MRKTKIIHFLSVITCLILLLFTYFNNIDLHESHLHLKHTKITLYVDTAFDDYGYSKIVQAASEWTIATHHLVEYNVVRLPSHNINAQDGIFISNVSSSFPEIIWRDRSGGATLGIYLGRAPLRTILLVGDRLDEDTYKPTILHELGHSLGLEHTEFKDIGTLMYPFIDLGSDTITKKDLEQFCKLHDCDVTQL